MKLLKFLLRLLPFLILCLFIVDLFSYRFLERFLVGASHGKIGLDFYSVPRSFINLQHDKSIFHTGFAHWYGQYATLYFYHPAVSILAGSWLSLFSPDVAFAVFVAVIAALLLYAGFLWTKHFTSPTARSLVLLLTACSLPGYLLMWNAQMHIFTVLSVAIILSATIDLYNGKNSSTKLIAGLLISLFTKPIMLLWIPALVIVKETRPATVRALVIYAVVSAIFFLVPFLNPEGDNYIHWKNIVSQSRRVEQHVEYFSFATTFPLPLPGKLKNSLYLLTPLLLCASVLWLIKMRDAQKKLRALIVLLLALLVSYYFAYTMVWEYHYTTIMAAMPCLLYLYKTSEGKERRWLLYAFIAGLLLYLPTTYFLLDELNETNTFIMHLTKVIPATFMLGALTVVLYRSVFKSH
ncbi:MAG TPA: glycosyltransferase 87 family protein [Flavisolibacter sp.]|nr:glycosyltransferase 87 family protein [Flavisolibacter sp.]